MHFPKLLNQVIFWSSLVAGVATLSAQSLIVIDPKNANPALRNNVPVVAVTYTINGNPVVQNAPAVTNQTSAVPVFASSITLAPGSGNETVIFFNDIAAQVRNNNFAPNTGPRLGVYDTSAPTELTIVNDGLPAFEAAVVNTALNNNVLNYIFYDGSLQNMPNASTADFDVLYFHAWTPGDYLVVGERDGNTYFALVPLGADGNPIPGANTLQFSPGPPIPGPGNGHDWNTGYINANDLNTTQPVYFTVASIAKFFENTSVPAQDRFVFGYRIDNNGNADVKFFGASERPFTDNPVNPLLAPGTVGDFVWFDANANGIQDPGELGINGVTVNLLDSLGNQMLDLQGNPFTTVTANDGNGNPGYYLFTDVLPADYQIEFVAPPEYRFTLQNQGSDDALDSDADPATGRTPVFTLGVEEDNTTLDAGLVDASFIGNFVWIDTDGDGIQDPGETGLNGVTVNLLDGGGNFITSTTTANDSNGDPGHYLFGNLVGGTYIVEFVLPAGYAFTSQNAGGQGVLGGAANSDADTSTGRTPSFTISLGSGTTNVDAGLLQADLAVEKSVTPASTIEGATVTFTVTVTNLGPTATTGVVVTDALPAGLTFAGASADQGSYNSANGAWTVGALALNATATLTLTATTNAGTAGSVITNTASITASDVPDPNPNNNSDDADVAVSALQITKSSDAVGPVNHGDTITYTIEVENVGAGTISGVDVQDVLPAGVTYVPNSVQAALNPVPTPQSETRTTPGSGTFVVPAGVSELTVEVWGGGGKGGSTSGGGNQPRGGGGGGAYSRSVVPVTPGSINLFVGAGSTSTAAGQDSWFVNASTLMAKGGNSNQDNATGAAGGLFSAGFGTVRYSGGNGATGSGSVAGGGGSSAGSAANGNNAVTSTGGTAPTDGGAGGNGRTGTNGVGLPGNTPGGGGGGAFKAGGAATLSGGNGANGQVRISWDVAGGTTGVPPNLASGWTLEPGATLTITFEVTLDNDAFVTELTNIASVTSDDDPEPLSDDVTDPVNFATVGDFVWIDTNGNGIQDSGELGLPGVTVNLLDENGDPVDLGSGPVITTTTAGGAYSFAGLPPGSYSVGFVLPGGFVFTTPNADGAGLDGTVNSDANPGTGITPVFTLASGQTNNNVDAGAFLVASIAGNVFEDLNRLTDNTVNGTGTNAGGIHINLVNPLDNTVIASIPVNSDGTYIFGAGEGVLPDTGYQLILTTDPQTTGNILTASTLPTPWISTGENLGTGPGSDGTPDGILAVSTTTGPLTNANFGIVQVPDVAPVFTAFPNIMRGPTNLAFTIRVTELNQVDSDGQIVVRVPKDLRWVLDGPYDPSLTTLANVALNNADWTYSEDASNHIFTTSITIQAGQFSVIGFRANWDSGQTQGIYTATSQIDSSSGGEDRIDNNVDAEIIDYFIN